VGSDWLTKVTTRSTAVSALFAQSMYIRPTLRHCSVAIVQLANATLSFHDATVSCVAE